ncbi:MAG TPA: PAS domain S-box protein [Dehalococcoidia bacterium]|nr:PAS domain S-box protein [Dehalococcoidia bacterium]
MVRQTLNEERASQTAGDTVESAFQIFEASPVATLVVGPDSTIEYANLAFQELTQFSAEELAALRAPYPWLPNEERGECLKNLREAGRRGWKRTEKLIRKRNGHECWTEITVVPVRENGTLKHYFQTWIDITGSKKVEHKTKKKSELLQWNYDVARMASRTDISFDEIFRELCTLLQNACPLPEKTSVRMVVNTDEYKTPNFRETPWQQASHIRVRGVRVGRVEVHHLEEITDKAILEEEKPLISSITRTAADVVVRMRARELSRVLLDSSPIGIYIVRDGRFLYVNPEFQRYTGYTAEELMGKNSLNLVYHEDRAQVKQNTVNTLKGQMFSPYECRVVSKDGQIRWIVEKTTSIIYEGKRSVLGYYMDIDDRKKLEWDVAKYKELDDLKKTLLSTVSHELRTPLSNVKGYANLLLEHQHKLNEDDWLDFVRGIDKDTDRLTIFVNDLLNLSRLEAGLLSVDKKLRSINRLVKEVVSEAQIRHPHHLITCKETGRLPRVRMDTRRIRQVLDNLIDNACKYSADGTRVKVSASQTGNEILLGVSDQGIGIATENLEKVFDPMYRIKHEGSEKIPGIGLGLSVCKGLIDSHGGRIWMESELGKGSTCWFTLPLATGNI